MWFNLRKLNNNKQAKKNLKNYNKKPQQILLQLHNHNLYKSITIKKVTFLKTKKLKILQKKTIIKNLQHHNKIKLLLNQNNKKPRLTLKNKLTSSNSLPK